MNNLNELNTILFDTLRGVKNGTINASQAKNITNVSVVIVNSAKVQLDMYKATKDKTVSPVFFDSTVKQIKILGNNIYDRKASYAKQLGFASATEAIDELGQEKFNSDYTKCLNSENT